MIPAIVGRKITDIERKIFALPVRLGGMGIQNPMETADREFRNSTLVTRNLARMIRNQESDLANYDAAKMKEIITQLKTEKEENMITQLEEIKTLLNESDQRTLELAGEKGAGAWLTLLPLESTGYVLNKVEFRDAICLRYDKKIPGTPSYCACGEKNSTNHTLNCKLGGFVTMRHNNIRDVEASLLRGICKDVRIEPELIP